MAKSEKPFNKIMIVRARLAMYVEHGEAALQGQTPQEFATEVHECFSYLMEFRNIINGMVSFDQTPSRAVLPYLSEEVLQDAALMCGE
jgi:hypothetical protein